MSAAALFIAQSMILKTTTVWTSNYFALFGLRLWLVFPGHLPYPLTKTKKATRPVGRSFREKRDGTRTIHVQKAAMSAAWAAVGRVAMPHIAAYVDNLTPFCVTHCAARCCSHFEKYMICTGSDGFAPITQGSCVQCLAEINCCVRRHRHVQIEGGICGILYAGIMWFAPEATSPVCNDGEETSYLWLPRYGMLLCHGCCQDAEEPEASLEKQLKLCACFKDSNPSNIEEWIYEYREC